MRKKIDNFKVAHGFTLIEILAALAVIVLLVGMAAQALGGGRVNSQRNVCVGNLRAIEAAKNEWALQEGIPGSVQVVDTAVVKYRTAVNRYITSFKVGRLPLCPSGGVYTYGYTPRFDDNSPRPNERPSCSLEASLKHKLPDKTFEKAA